MKVVRSEPDIPAWIEHLQSSREDKIVDLEVIVCDVFLVDPEKLFILHLNDVEERPLESIEDAHRLLPGEGVIPLAGILEHLAGTGFDGLCSIELFRPEYWERDPLELAKASRAAAQKVLKPYFDL